MNHFMTKEVILLAISPFFSVFPTGIKSSLLFISSSLHSHSLSISKRLAYLFFEWSFLKKSVKSTIDI